MRDVNRESELRPGVFVYKAIVVFKDKKTEVRTGDVTLMK
jgi:hypothetical protein